jgi:hypothetical protein
LLTFLQGERKAMPYFHIDAEAYSIGFENANYTQELDRFPENFQIGTAIYTKAGITFNQNNLHFVNVIRHNKEWVYYDGIRSDKRSRFFKDIKETYSNYRIVSFDYVVVPSASN